MPVDVPVQVLDPQVEPGRVAALRDFRAARDGAAASGAVARLTEAARGEGELMEPIRDALRARATLGEVCEALRAVWGEHSG